MNRFLVCLTIIFTHLFPCISLYLDSIWWHPTSRLISVVWSLLLITTLQSSSCTRWVTPTNCISNFCSQTFNFCSLVFICTCYCYLLLQQLSCILPRELRWFQEWFMSLMSRGNNAPWAPLSWWIRALYKSTYYYYYYYYWLHVLYFLNITECLVDCSQFIESNALFLMLAGLSSYDGDMRRAAYHVMALYLDHLEGARFRGRREVEYHVCWNDDFYLPWPYKLNLLTWHKANSYNPFSRWIATN